MTDHRDDAHFVYVHRDVFGVVLYVGVTHDVEKRTAQHRAGSWWGKDIRSVDVESVQPNRREGLIRERRVIRQLEPLHNAQSNPRHERNCIARSILVDQFGLNDGAAMIPRGTPAADALLDVIYALGPDCINDPSALELMGWFWRANAFAGGGDLDEWLRADALASAASSVLGVPDDKAQR